MSSRTPSTGARFHIPASVRWPAGIVALLMMSVVIQSIGVYLAHGDPSFAVEPDYERKAEHYNDVIEQRQQNKRLGWTVTVRTTPPIRVRGDVTVDVRITDVDGRPLEGAAVSFDACHIARAAKILHATAVDQGDGLYTVDLPMTRTGIWEFRIVARRVDDTFTATVRQDVLVTPAPASRPGG